VKCGFQWGWRGWQKCELAADHDDRHVCGTSWVRVGCEHVVEHIWAAVPA